MYRYRRDERKKKGGRPLEERVEQAIRWASMAQPADAVITQHGIKANVDLPEEVGSRSCQIGASLYWKPPFNGRRDGPYLLINVSMEIMSREFQGPELGRLLAYFRDRWPVDSHWSAFGDDLSRPSRFLSVALDTPIAASLENCLDNYREGCRVHPDESVFCRCHAWLDRFNKVEVLSGWRR